MLGDPPISGIAEPLNQRIADLAREILGEPGAISRRNPEHGAEEIEHWLK